MPVIEIKKLKKYFGKTRAVDGIDISIEKGTIFGFLGPNGAGKTTAIRCMLDFIKPTSGEIKIAGLNPQDDSEKLKSKIGYLPGSVRLYDGWTEEDHIKFLQSYGGKIEVANSLIKILDFDRKLKFRHLSSGNKQKLGIILALMKKPEILILDEPTNSLDPLLQNQVHKILKDWKNDGLTIFMSSHNLFEVDQVCDRVGIIKEGKMIAAENIKELKEKRLHYVTATFASSFNKEDFKIANVESVDEIDSSLMIKFRGDIDPLIKILAKHKLKDLEMSHATLEEIFLEFYN